MAEREVQKGAEAFRQMLDDLATEESRLFIEIEDDYEDDADPRVYVAMVRIVERSFPENFERASPQRR